MTRRYGISGLISASVVAGGLMLPVKPAWSYSLDFELANQMTQPITDLWASPRRSNNWGTPFADVFVPAGGTQKITFNGTGTGEACYYDIRMKFRNGDTRTVSNIDLCAIRTLTVSMENGRVVYNTR